MEDMTDLINIKKEMIFLVNVPCIIFVIDKEKAANLKFNGKKPGYTHDLRD